jgi:oligopeptide transport system ATP-binding protein
VSAGPSTTRPDDALVVVKSLWKTFRLPGTQGSRKANLVAVGGVDFTVERGGSLGLVGESGSGKTTIARMVSGLDRPTSGTISVAGRDRSTPARRRAERKQRGRELQIVFQDPYTSLDPRQSVNACIEEVLRIHLDLDKSARRRRTLELLEQVGLDAEHGRSLPQSLSGGQRQRVAIARALAGEPQVLILDEAVSALDVSIQAQVINLLNEIRERTGMTYIFISHNLAVVRQLTEDTLVLQRGQAVEYGSTDQVIGRPRHDYTRRLLDAVPGPGWQASRVRQHGSSSSIGELGLAGKTEPNQQLAHNT